MEAWGTLERIGKGSGAGFQEDRLSTCPERPSSSVTPTRPDQATSPLLSSLASAACSHPAMDLSRLKHELKAQRGDMKDFQAKVTETLLKVETSLGFLAEAVSRMELRSNAVLRSLREEERRGVARNKILSFLLSREKDLRRKCSVLENMLCKKRLRERKRRQRGTIWTHFPLASPYGDPSFSKGVKTTVIQ
uniref:Uncharacterized protein n=1 Tax=Salvator merianae TaxID=96440 RepID=A0A8D0C3T5_SALMN